MELVSAMQIFYAAIENDARIGPTHISIYLALLQQWNLLGQQNPFAIERDALMKAAKIKGRCTYNKCLKNLQEYGYINYQPASNSFKQSVIRLKET